MRDIKFRAWDKKRKQVRDVLSIQYFQKPLPELGAVRMVPEEDTVDKETDNFHSDIVLMQYTGLKDKNGIEIYEGDIVKSKSGSIGFYEYSITYLSYLIITKSDNELVNVLPTIEPYSPDIEVIGNIHENPELLK